jgi:CheY-like chemotaxis protein
MKAPPLASHVLLIGRLEPDFTRLLADLSALGYSGRVVPDETAALTELRIAQPLPDWIIVREGTHQAQACRVATTIAAAAPELASAARILALAGPWALSVPMAAAGFRSAVPALCSLGTLAALLGPPLSPSAVPTPDLSAPPAAPLARAKAVLAPIQFIRVLLVDDNSVNRLMMSTWLEKLGIEHHVASNGHEFLDMAADGSFDLFLIDHQMPDLDGVEALNLYRSAAADPMVPAVLISADVQSETVARALRAGFSDVIAKPLRLERLVPAMLDAFRPTDSIARAHARHEAMRTASATGLETPAPEATTEVEDDALIDPEQIGAAIALDPLEAGAFVLRLTSAYGNDAKVVLARMRQATSAGDWPSLWDAAHALKGNSVNVGARVAALCCERLEAMSPEDLRQHGSSRIDELDLIVSRSIAQINLSAASRRHP